MFSVFARIFRVLFSKAALVVVLWVVVLGGVAGWLYVKEKYNELPDQYKETISRLTDVKEAKKLADRKLIDLRESAAAKKMRLVAAAQVAEAKRQRIVRLQDALSGILGFFTGEETKEKLDAEKAALARTEAEVSALKEEIGKIDAEAAAQKKEAVGLTSEIDALEKRSAEQQGELSWWDQKKAGGWKRVKEAFAKVGVILVIVTVAILVVPFLLKLILYFLISPLMAAARPIRIRSENFRSIEVSETAVAKEIELTPGEFAIIRPQFYQASDERLRKRTKFVFDWHYPFTSMACGLIEMTRVVNRDETRRALTLSSQDEAEIELAVVSVPEDGSVVMRPSYLAGYVGAEGKPPRIRTHWKLFSLHSWLTLQFRYFEFEGPAKLVLSGLRGVRAERLTKRDIEQKNRKRTNQDSTIGFTPTLKYHSVRAETFWAYFREQNPLFDDVFTGEGTFLCQQIPRSRKGGAVRRFWSALWNGFTKIFGI